MPERYSLELDKRPFNDIYREFKMLCIALECYYEVGDATNDYTPEHKKLIKADISRRAHEFVEWFDKQPIE